MSILLQVSQEFITQLESIATDAEGIVSERLIAVAFDSGVTPDWENWLALFNQGEKKPYRLISTTPVETDSEF